MISLWVLLVIMLCCVASVPITWNEYANQKLDYNRHAPQLTADYRPHLEEGDRTALEAVYDSVVNVTHGVFGYDMLGRSMLWRCLFGGLVSLGIGLAAALIAVFIGTGWGLVAGWYGGRVDNAMMRVVDVLYGLPYVLLVILLKVAFEDKMIHLFTRLFGPGHERIANIVILFVAIGSVSWLTMARVIRGQVLSLKALPYAEAARAMGLPTGRILVRHILPNLVGPIIVYATLTVPQAILQESFLSFLGIGIQAPVPTWGSLAAEGVKAVNTVVNFWWMVFFPSFFLGVTLLCLNFIGDGLRDAFDPREVGRGT